LPLKTGDFVAHLFGAFEVFIEGEPLSHLRSRKGQLLLAVLLLRANTEVSRDWLAGSLWHESETPQARTSLRQSLADLRQALGTQAFRIESPSPNTLLFRAQGSEIDCLTFQALCQKATPAAEAEAFSLYQPLLEGWHDPLVINEQSYFREQAIELCERLSLHEIAERRFTDAIRTLRKGLTIDSLRESLYGHLMRIFAQRGEFAEAMKTFQELRHVLREEMGVEPTPETVALYQSLRTDVRNQMREIKRETPPPLTTPLPPKGNSNVPRPLTRLIGREEECREVEKALQVSPLVSLLGTGGVGKTRLALEVAGRLLNIERPLFPDGVWFVGLAHLTDPDFVAPSIAAVLGIKESHEVPLVQALLRYLSERSLFLVIDNCEQVIGACAQIAQEIVNSAPDVHLLITSREPLGLQNETRYRLASLSLPPEQGSMEVLQETPAFQLFLERARQARPSFTLTPKKAAEIGQICRHLDGIPLAIELAAARLNILNTEQLLQRLEDRFRILTGGNRAALPRHQTLRATLDWSYDHLSREEQSLFQRLSLFAGEFFLEDAEAVCGEEETLSFLGRLVDRSLVVADLHIDTEPRYSLLESLKAYGREKLRQSGEYDIFYRKFCDCYVQLVQNLYPRIGRMHEGDGATKIKAVYANIRAILQEPPDETTLLHLTAIMARYWMVSAELHEGRYWIERAYQKRDSMGEEDCLRALMFLGTVAWMQSENQRGLLYLEEALQRAEQAKLPHHIRFTRVGLGLIYAAERRHKDAYFHYNQALHYAKEMEDRSSQASVVGNIACLQLEERDIERAEATFRECKELYLSLNDAFGIAYADLYLAHVEEWRGNWDSAYQGYIPAVLALARCNQWYYVNWGLAFLSNVQVKRKEFRSAAYVRGFLEVLREQEGYAANATQEEAEERDQSAILEALGAESYTAIKAEVRLWTREQALASICQP
jgi:predicted ATPase/DNA-binding SARP family transcriptional activator